MPVRLNEFNLKTILYSFFPLIYKYCVLIGAICAQSVCGPADAGKSKACQLIEPSKI
jgi:hypothetical protein